MTYRLFADGLLLLHFAFILFVAGGGFLCWRWPKLAWLHLPAAAWGAFIEATGRVCPLTPLESSMREAAGLEGYAEGFIDHWLRLLIYPPGLTREIQWGLAAGVVLVNLLAYGVLYRRMRANR